MILTEITPATKQHTAKPRTVITPNKGFTAFKLDKIILSHHNKIIRIEDTINERTNVRI
jgi:hypothetical protein